MVRPVRGLTGRRPVFRADPARRDNASCLAAAACGLETSVGPMTVGPVRSADTLTLERDGNGWRLSGAATRLPYACHAARTVLIADGPDGEMAVGLENAGGATLTNGKNIANEPRDTLTFANVRLSVGSRRARREWRLTPGIVSAGRSRAGCHDVRRAGEGHGSGGELCPGEGAVRSADLEVPGGAAEPGRSGGPDRRRRRGRQPRNRGPFRADPDRQEFLIGVAKTRVGEAATLACEIAHQVHGAIGFTKEYALQLSTRRLWSWREEFGGDPEWAARVGAYACRRGADLWPMLTDG